MTDQQLAIRPADSIDQPAPLPSLDEAVAVYLAGKSERTRSEYRARLERFQRWRDEQPAEPFVASLSRYVTHLQAQGLSPRSVQAHVNTVKGLLKAGAALDPRLAAHLPALSLVKPPPVRGDLQGQRLAAHARQSLLDAPGVDTHKGRRDTAILALMAVCGLRRSEVVNLNWGHVDELDGHKVIRNLRGKHGRVRTVKLPVALWRLLRAWGELASLDTSDEAPVFVQVRRGDNVQHGVRISGSAVSYIVATYTGAAGLDNITPHDLRRTAASLSRKGGASIEQVQLMLGHADPQTTSRYIGASIDLDDHAVDYGAVKIPAP